MKLAETRNSKPLPKFKTRCSISRYFCPCCATCATLNGIAACIFTLLQGTRLTSHAGCRHGLRLPPEEDCLLGINMQLAHLRGGKAEEPQSDRYNSSHVCQQQPPQGAKYSRNSLGRCQQAPVGVFTPFPHVCQVESVFGQAVSAIEASMYRRHGFYFTSSGPQPGL